MTLPSLRPIRFSGRLAGPLIALLAAAAGVRAAPPPVIAEPPPLPYTVTPHDTLIGLNRTLFTTPGAWREVARLNHLSDADKIAPGQVLLVPARFLQSKQVPAQLVSVFGDVRVAGKPAVVGTPIDVGDAISTGQASTAVVALADGSRVKLAADTEGRLDEQRRFRIKATAAAIDTGLVAATLRLLSGSVEVLASKVLRARPLEVSTPTAVIGVRGTSYRVRNDVTTTAAGRVDVSATEVLEGKVHAQVVDAPGLAADVPADFGAPLPAGKAPEVLPLPPAPDLSSLPATFDHLPLQLHVDGDTPLRAQVADDAAFDHVLLDLHVAAGEDVRIPQLADGIWHLRIRRISPEGLEGLDGVRSFELRSRPAAPILSQPPADGKLPVGHVVLRWTPEPGTARYVVEVARDAAFAQPVLHVDDVQGNELAFDPPGSDYGAPDGTYWWRVASIAADGRRSEVGQPQRFFLRPTPRIPFGSVSPDGRAIELRWGGDPQDREDVELARDPAFADVITRASFAAGHARLGRPAAGIYYARYRFVEPDGFRTAWSDPVRIVVDSDWRQGWRALVPNAWIR